MSPREIESSLNGGLALFEAGKHDEAERVFSRVLRQAPRNFDGWHLGGALAYHAGDHALAIRRLKRALELQPQHPSALLHLGAAFVASGEPARAEPLLGSAARKLPARADAWRQWAETLRTLGRAGEAIDAFRHLAGLAPGEATAWESLGNLLQQTGDHPGAVEAFKKALAADASRQACRGALAVSLAEDWKIDEALVEANAAVSAEPGNAAPRIARAFVHQRAYQMEDALLDYRAAAEVGLGGSDALRWSATVQNYLPGHDRLASFELHTAFGRSLFQSPKTPRGPVSMPLRVGFLSPDFRTHSVGWFALPLIRDLDPATVHSVLYHDSAGSDGMTAALKRASGTWREVAGLGDDAVGRLMKEDRLDVLVDLGGLFLGGRPALCARRPAPAVVSYLGYPNTTGISSVDYRLVDPISDPEEDSSLFHTETLVRFSSCAWAYAPPGEAPSPSRSDRPDATVFGCFSNFAKVTDRTLSAWAALLARTPGSRLVVKSRGLSQPDIRRRILTRAAQAGLDPDRIELREAAATVADHLAQYADIDVALDTFPYHGTTTTCEALWMGVPVVTLAGDRHASRVGASLLTAVGRTEWIAQDWNGYVDIAAGLAESSGRMDSGRHLLRSDMAASPLLDHPGQARAFAAALIRCAEGKTS